MTIIIIITNTNTTTITATTTSPSRVFFFFFSLLTGVIELWVFSSMSSDLKNSIIFANPSNANLLSDGGMEFYYEILNLVLFTACIDLSSSIITETIMV